MTAFTVRPGSKIKPKFGNAGSCVDKGATYEVKLHDIYKTPYFECRCGYFGIAWECSTTDYELVEGELSAIEKYIAKELRS